MKIGLVLGGGGARGAYQIGVWKALKELNVDKYVNVISGVSIGALNGAMYAQGDIELAEEIWNNVSIEKILPTDSINLFKRSFLISVGAKKMNFIKKYIPQLIEGGNVSKSGLESIIDENLDLDKIKNSGITCYAACTEVPKIKVRYFKLNDLEDNMFKKVLHASAAIPMIFESENIDGKQYVDGGIADNVPVQPVYQERCDLIIVVGLMKGYRVDRSIYSDVEILEIIPSNMESGFIDGALEFTPQNSTQRMELGYKDTMNQIKPIVSLMKFVEEKEKPSMIESLKNLFKTKKAL